MATQNTPRRSRRWSRPAPTSTFPTARGRPRSSTRAAAAMSRWRAFSKTPARADRSRTLILEEALPDDPMNPPPREPSRGGSADKLELSIALSDNENTRAVLDGRFQPDAVKLYPTALHPSEMFWRQLKFAEFDVSEMSMSS